MGYRDRLVEVCARDGWDAALELLRGIFHDPSRQRAKGTPTDFLNDEDDKKVTAGQGFDQLVEGFRPRESIAKRVEFLVECLGQEREEYEPRHAFQPFNAIAFKVGDYERCDIVADSLHVDAAREISVKQFGLNHELIRAEDSHEEYTFTYDLTYHPDQYTFELDGERLSGNMLHHDVKLVVFARWLVKLVRELCHDERFAAFPKALPFSFVMVGDEGSKHMGTARPAFRAPLIAPITEASLADNPQRAAWIAAAAQRGETGPDERFLFLLPSAPKLDSSDRRELVALATEHAHLRALIVEIANEVIARAKQPPARRGDDDDDEEQPAEAPPADVGTRAREVCRFGPVTMSRLLRSIGGAELAVDYERQILELPMPAMPERRDDVLEVAQRVLATRYALRAGIPESEWLPLTKGWELAMDAYQAAAAEEPVLAIVLAEYEAAPEITVDGRPEEPDADDEDQDSDSDPDGDGDDDDGDSEESPLAWLDDELHGLPRYVRAMCEDPPAGYLEAVMAAARRMGPRMGSWAGIWDVIYKRVLALGPRAERYVPDVVAWGRAWCTRAPGVYVDERIAGHFAKMLFVMGAEDVPDYIHAEQSRNRYSTDEVYERWAAIAPKRRLDAFVAAFEADASAFDDPATWERHIYDSAPALKMYVHALVGEDDTPARLPVDAVVPRVATASRAAGPLLTKLIYPLVDHFSDSERDDGWACVRAVLEHHPALDPKYAAQLRRARAHATLLAHDRDAVAAKDEVGRLCEQYPGLGLGYFLAARVALAESGPAAAIARTRNALRALSADDIVYRKAITEYAGVALDAADQLTDATVYAYLRLAIDGFIASNYRGGKLRDSNHAFDNDPFYELFAERLSKLEPAERAAAIDAWRAELAMFERLRTLPDDALPAQIDPKQWPVSLQIARRLAKSAEPWRLAALLDIWGMFAADESRREALAQLIWPVEGWRRPFVVDDRVRPHVAWLIESYPGIGAKDLARAVFALQREAGRPDLVIETVAGLDDRIVIATFVSVLGAYQASRDYAGAIAMIERVGADIKRKDPTYVLLQSNRAVMHVLAGQLAEAEQVLDALFAADWSRFHYSAKKDDFALSLGLGDLDAQYAATFRIYFAMAKFNAACVYAKTARPDPAIDALREAIRLNPDGYPAAKLRAETDFASLADDPRFQQLANGGQP
jgi:hypothetical protein